MSLIKSSLLLVIVLLAAVSAKPKFQQPRISRGNFKAECGETVTGTGGTILSTNYPGNYNRSELCEWSLTSTNNVRIALIVRDFDIEYTYDMLDIYDGPDDQSPLMISLTGQGSNLGLLTTGSQAFLRFTSDLTVNAGGFNITWSEYSGKGAIVKDALKML